MYIKFPIIYTASCKYLKSLLHTKNLYKFSSAIDVSDWFWSCTVHLIDLFERLCQVATFIVQKVLLDDVGLEYMCTTAERFFALGRVLGNMVTSLAEGPSARLLKHIIRCYLRLTDNPRCNNYPFSFI